MKCAKVCFVIIIIVASVYSRATRTPRPSILPREKDKRFPSEFRLKDNPSWRVPSARFCSEQDLQPAAHYVVLPWWYTYCQERRERRERQLERNGIVPNLLLYKDVLRRVNEFKKQKAKMNLKD